MPADSGENNGYRSGNPIQIFFAGGQGFSVKLFVIPTPGRLLFRWQVPLADGGGPGQSVPEWNGRRLNRPPPAGPSPPV